MVNDAAERTLGRLLAIGASLITIFVLAGSVSDPVNVTKFLLLGGTATAAAAAPPASTGIQELLALPVAAEPPPVLLSRRKDRRATAAARDGGSKPRTRSSIETLFFGARGSREVRYLAEVQV